MKQLGKQFLVFSLVGVLTTSVQYVFLLSLVEFVHIKAVLASSIGFIAGALVSYGLNRCITFQSTKKHPIAMIQFACVAGVAFIMNALLMAFATHSLHLQYLLAQVMTTIIVLFWNFIANRHWTFRHVTQSTKAS